MERWKSLREKKLAEKEAETNILLNEAKEKSNYIKDLENKVNLMPDVLEKDYKYSIELLKKDYENKIDRQNDKIELLNEEINKMNLEKNLYKKN